MKRLFSAFPSAPALPRLALISLLLAGCAQPAAPTEEDGVGLPWADEGHLRAAAVQDGDNILSDQNWTAATSGYGPIEKDRSNGQTAAGDGKALTIGGQTYAKGLGVHANSSVTYALNGQCSTFTATVGVDDEVGNLGSVAFQVFADGAKLYDSGTVRGADGAKSVNVSVAGKKELKLVVTDAGDGLNYDHADWATPTLGGCTSVNTIRINAGGPAQNVGGVLWRGCETTAACNGYVTGGFSYREADAITGVQAPANDALYQSEWTGGQTNGVARGDTAFAFHIPVPNGRYDLRLHFTELNKTAAGQRLFDVNVEGGAAELTNLDVFADSGGQDRALVRTLPVTVTDGTLDVAFVRQVENAKVSALEVLPQDDTDGGPVGHVALAPTELVFSGVKNAATASQAVTVRNAGGQALRVDRVRFTGDNADRFELVNPSAQPFTVAPGASVTLNVRFAPKGTVGALSAALHVESSDPAQPDAAVNVYGLSTNGEQGDLEPPLQQVVQTLGYNINVGGSKLILGTGAAPIGDEVIAPLFTRAGSGPVTLTPVARYSPDDLLPFGYYLPGSAPDLHAVATIARGNEQTLRPALAPGGATGFDPGSATFGFYVGATSYAAQNTYTEDGRNTGPTRHGVRVYPLKDRAGQAIANSYLLAFEPASNGDYQDYVFVVTNVQPAAPSAGVLTWTRRADAPRPISEAQGEVVDNKLYVFGGFNTDLSTVHKSSVYDLAADRWAAVADIPEDITHGAVAVDGQTIYIAGGFIGRHPGPQTNHVWKYNVTTNTWSAGPNLPGARGAGALVRLGRELHFFGGTERDLNNLDVYKRDSADHWVLKLDGGTTWTSAAPLPNPRNHIAGAQLNGLIYAIGGQHLGDEVGGDQSTVQSYNPATNSWTTRASLPLPLGHINSSTVVWNGRILVIAGVTLKSLEVANVSQYDPATDRWTALTPLPEARQSPIAGILNNRLVVTTGSLPSGAKATTWVGDLR